MIINFNCISFATCSAETTVPEAYYPPPSRRSHSQTINCASKISPYLCIYLALFCRSLVAKLTFSVVLNFPFFGITITLTVSDVIGAVFRRVVLIYGNDKLCVYDIYTEVKLECENKYVFVQKSVSALTFNGVAQVVIMECLYGF